MQSRDTRAAFQQRLISSYNCPLISFTVNYPGNVKTGDTPRAVFDAGVAAIRERFAGSVAYYKLRDYPTGYEGFFVTDLFPPGNVKKITCEIESRHPLGRLFDMDVLDDSGHIITREEINEPTRTCLLCDMPAAACVRNRTHGVTELLNKIEGMVKGYKDSKAGG